MALPILTFNPGLLAIWLSPRRAANRLLETKGFFTHATILIVMAAFYFFEVLAFVWIGDLWHVFRAHSAFKLFVWSYLSILAALTVVLNLLALAIYYPSRALGGVGGFAQTKTVCYWASLYTLPAGLCCLSFIWTGLIGAKAAEEGAHDFLLTDAMQLLSAAGIAVFVIYGLASFSKMLSEIHRISTGKAVLAAAGGLCAAGLLAPLILMTAIQTFAPA